jgi:glycosyltransferase involved in cell wall biosynthesis
VRIGIDATVAAAKRTVGISRFIANLVRELAALDERHTYYLFYRPRAWKNPWRVWKPDDPRFRIRLLQEPFHRSLRRSLDVFHATYQRLPGYREGVRYLGSLHDIFYLSQPDMGSPRTRQRWQARYRDVAEHSELVMTLSEYSKGEILRHLAVPAERVRVVPLAVEARYAPQGAARVEDAQRRHGLPGSYVLFAGGFGRRKNALRAAEAFARALPHLPRETALAISGASGPLEAEVRRFVRDAGIAARVKILGFVPEEDQPALMSGCLAFLFPSLLEGFGLPPLEAMACGAPVVASSTTSLPEVCGDAALLVDPLRPEEIAAALVEIARSDRLRRELREKGLQRARQFSWKRTAQAILGLYREVASETPGPRDRAA